MSENLSVREFVTAVAGPRGWNETRESWLARSARQAGVSYRAAKALFYGEITDPDHKAARRMRDAATKKARQEAANLAAQYQRIAEAMNVTDPDFYSADVAALLSAARLLSGKDRTGDNGGGG